MFKVTFLAMMLSVSTAFGAGYNNNYSHFSISQFTADGSRVYYNCDSVEDTVSSVLRKMGANISSVRCTGGLDRFGQFHSSAVVKVSFESLSSKIDQGVAAHVEAVEFKVRNNCHLYNSIVKGVSESFEISSLKIRKCRKPGDRVRIKMNVLKAI